MRDVGSTPQRELICQLWHLQQSKREEEADLPLWRSGPFPTCLLKALHLQNAFSHPMPRAASLLSLVLRGSHAPSEQRVAQDSRTACTASYSCEHSVWTTAVAKGTGIASRYGCQSPSGSTANP